MHAYAHTDTHAHKHTHIIHTHMHMHTHTHTHARIHTIIHTHTHTHNHITNTYEKESPQLLSLNSDTYTCATNRVGPSAGQILMGTSQEKYTYLIRWCELSLEFGSRGTKFSVKILFNTPTVVMCLS